MKNYVFICFLFVMLSVRPVLAAELIEVRPVESGSNVAVEITADIPMTYTYYKVPGEARAVVDIADADPEKIEPLIVVNKGAVASISVDKAKIGDMVISRLIFNLAADADISVKQSPDRKKLNVSFGVGTSDASQPVSAPSQPVSKEADDALDLDVTEPAAALSKVPGPIAVISGAQEPVAPVTEDKVSRSTHVVKGIVIGASFIVIQTDGLVDKFKALRLAKPERLLIEIPGTNAMSVTSVQVKRLGLSKIRIGTAPGVVRVVLDADSSTFPAYEIVSVENGVRINLR